MSIDTSYLINNSKSEIVNEDVLEISRKLHESNDNVKLLLRKSVIESITKIQLENQVEVN